MRVQRYGRNRPGRRINKGVRSSFERTKVARGDRTFIYDEIENNARCTLCGVDGVGNCGCWAWCDSCGFPHVATGPCRCSTK